MNSNDDDKDQRDKRDEENRTGRWTGKPPAGWFDYCLESRQSSAQDPPRPWRRSKRGSAWRVLGDGRTCTVFRTSQGAFRWVVSDHDSPIYSAGDYATELAAIDAVEELEALE